MEKLISNFPNQLEEALIIGKQIKTIDPHTSTIHNILIVGLGGSGIGGTIVKNYLSPICNLPIIVTKNYFIPAFVDQNTLVIISSYSGNTEETISAYKQAIEKDATICVVTSGGTLSSMAQAHRHCMSIIPDGMPPRACMGYNFIQVLFFLKAYGIIDASFMQEIKNSIDTLRSDQELIKENSKEIASKIFDKIPIIYSEANYEGVAIRWRQQINENAKMLCWHHTIPEMNHNELVGWTVPNEQLAVLLIRSRDDYERSQYRMEINKEIIKAYTPHIFEIHAKGNTYLEQALYLIHFGDWLSLHIGNIKGIDINEVKVIDYLKKELAKK